MKGNKFLYFNSTAGPATVTVGELTLTAVKSDATGNTISITIAESGTESEVNISVSGNAITAEIGTSDDMGADDIATAINADADASALVVATNSGTTHITAAVSETFLTGGGEVFAGFPLSSFTGMQPTGDSELTLYFRSMKNHDGHTSGSGEEIVSDSVALTLVTANTHRELMAALCEQFSYANAKAGYGDLFIGNDQSGKEEYISSLISAVGTITVADALS